MDYDDAQDETAEGSVDDLNIERWEEGELILKVLDKEILTRGAWATIMFLYQELDPKTKVFKPPAARIVRYHKVKGRFRPQSKMNISNAKQGLAIATVLQKWFK